MPDIGEIVGQLVAFVGELIGASALRFGVVTTLVLIGVPLILLQLVARPLSRWVSADAGRLGAVSRAMALAAEAGSDAVVSLGAAGLVRSTDALARLQTLAALPILGHVARAAARSGVSLRVLSNDPAAVALARSTLDAAHVATATPERAGASRAVFVGEGRATMAGLVLASAARPAAAIATGSLREEAQLHLGGLSGTAGSLHAGTAETAETPTLLLNTPAVLIGPELYQAGAELRADADERTMVAAANRLILIVLAVVIVGAALAAGGVADLRGVLLGVGQE